MTNQLLPTKRGSYSYLWDKRFYHLTPAQAEDARRNAEGLAIGYSRTVAVLWRPEHAQAARQTASDLDWFGDPAQALRSQRTMLRRTAHGLDRRSAGQDLVRTGQRADPSGDVDATSLVTGRGLQRFAAVQADTHRRREAVLTPLFGRTTRWERADPDELGPRATLRRPPVSSRR